AHPVGPLRPIPQTLNQCPALAAIGGAKQPAADGAGPERAVRPRGERPDLAHARGPVLALRRSIGLRKGRAGDLAPGRAVILRNMQLGPEMTELERRVEASRLGIPVGEGDAVAEEPRAADLPVASRLALEDEQSLAGRDGQELAHLSLPRALA